MVFCYLGSRDSGIFPIKNEKDRARFGRIDWNSSIPWGESRN